MVLKALFSLSLQREKGLTKIPPQAGRIMKLSAILLFAVALQVSAKAKPHHLWIETGDQRKKLVELPIEDPQRVGHVAMIHADALLRRNLMHYYDALNYTITTAATAPS